MVSYSVLGAAVVIAFALGVILGRRDERRRLPGNALHSAGTRVKHIDVPPRDDATPLAASLVLPAAEAAQDAELREHLEAGRMISAVKRYRELTGVGLREAKQAVEALKWPQ